MGYLLAEEGLSVRWLPSWRIAVSLALAAFAPHGGPNAVAQDLRSLPDVAEPASGSGDKAEFYWSRLRYTSSGYGRSGYGYGGGYGGYGGYGFGFGFFGWSV